MVSFWMNSLLSNHNCAAKLEICILHSMISAHFQFLCMGTNSKGVDNKKRSNSWLRFGTWDVLIRDKIGEVSFKGFRKERQSENAVQNLVMWESLFCVTRRSHTSKNILKFVLHSFYTIVLVLRSYNWCVTLYIHLVEDLMGAMVL